MKLLSNDLTDGQLIPKLFTCDGADFSPHLQWTDYPEETKSFAIMCLDYDTDQGILSHWYVHDIPRDINEIPQGGPVPGSEFENDFKTIYYEGPCQPDEVHTYHFIIHALDVETLSGLTPMNFRKTIREHSLDQAEIAATYQSEFKIKFRSCHG